MIESVSAPEILNVEIPTEPPIGSVALDPQGYAWQRRARDEHGVVTYWHRVQPTVNLIGPGVHARPWRYLLADHEALTLVYRASED